MEHLLMLKKKFKQHLYVNPGSLGEAADYYVESFGSVKKKGFFFPHCIELFVADTTLVLSEGIKDPARETQIRLEVPVNVIEVKEKALRAQNAVDYSEFISPEERARGIEAKVLDPYGYIWALSQAETSNICKLCFCSSSIHLCETLCTHPKTLTWINHVSQMSASVQELRDSIILEEVYRYMVVIRWAHLIVRFSSKEIGREVYDASERLDKVLLRVHSRLECVRLDLDRSPLEEWKRGVASVLTLLRTILAKIGIKEGMNDAINEELVHWIGLLA
ncbi:unnamed protein product [Brassica rapa]|uniref:Uncharacterized protein n=2 Tax=Brassica campestris TaxID=3711 RepID=A0A8D9H6V7_BRACM|nr:unnamed protein product [Brassica rapa]